MHEIVFQWKQWMWSFQAMKNIPQERFWLFRIPYERLVSLLTACGKVCRELTRPVADKCVQRVAILRSKKHQMWFEFFPKATPNKSSNMRWNPTRSLPPTENGNFQAISCMRRHIQYTAVWDAVPPPTTEVSAEVVVVENYETALTIYAQRPGFTAVKQDSHDHWLVNAAFFSARDFRVEQSF